MELIRANTVISEVRLGDGIERNSSGETAGDCESLDFAVGDCPVSELIGIDRSRFDLVDTVDGAVLNLVARQRVIDDGVTIDDAVG